MRRGPISSPPEGGTVTRARKLEQTLLRARWFGIALGAYQTFGYEPNPGAVVPASFRLSGGIVLAVLAIANIAAWLVLRRAPSERALQRLGLLMFAVDIVAVWAIVFVFSFERYTSSWTVLTLLPLEGAARFARTGALAPVVLAIPIETARELYVHQEFGHPAFVTSVIFRIGIIGMIAWVAGAMARNLERERHAAETRAEQLEVLAQREHEARVEIDAFQQVVLAGVSGQTVDEALAGMLERIAETLGYERIAVLLREDDELHPIAIHGFAPSVGAAPVSMTQGVAGSVVASGRAEIIPDVRKDDRYHTVDPTTRSQVTVPISAGEEVVGAIDVESPETDAFTSYDVHRLERLGRQMALVISNARLLSKERATVERLRELDVMKSDFVAIASHELRTPLTSMNGVIKTLRRDDLALPPEQFEEFLAILDRQSDRLTRLIEDLLVVSRIDAGAVDTHLSPVNIGATLEGMLDELGPASARVRIDTRELSTVVTDATRFGLIARNLTENALKFSNDDAPVEVSARQEHGTIVLTVRDHGPGIPASEVSRIFDRFHQVGGSMGRLGEGFGLGLYITKRLVEALGGTIDVTSAVGEGTTFEVTIPAHPVAGGPPDAASAQIRD